VQDNRGKDKYIERHRGKHCTCKQCKKKYVFGENSSNVRSLSICGSCVVTNSRRKTKQRAVEYKGGKCCLCGYNKCNSSLTFHHTNPENKKHKISTSGSLSWKEVKRELEKCVLICSNCHGEVHEGITKI